VSRYLDDVLAQPAALRAVHAHLCGDGRAALDGAGRLIAEASRVVFTGMGSAYWSALPAACAYEADHPSVHLRETSELLRRAPFARGTVYVVLSRSGESGEIAAFARRTRELGAKLVAITMTPTSALARAADVVVETRAPFDGLICIKAHTGLMLAALMLVDAAAGRATDGRALHALCDALDRDADATRARMAALAATLDAPSVPFLSHGVGMASAGLGALLVEEGVWLPSAAHGLDGFHHGPLELCDERFRGVVIDLEPDAASVERVASIRRRASGLAVLSPSQAHPGALPLPQVELPPAWRPLAAAPSLQLLVHAMAERRGREAGVMRHLQWLVT
jgi:glucosamine--fructose-6-phosphate aminotransferase (isomerizing)